MAITRVESQVQFSASSSITVSSNTQADSDAFSFDATTIMAGIVVSADNAGTPASGDYVDFYWKSSTGDVLGDSANDYETDEHATYLGRVDTVAANTPGEDPARKYFELPVGATAGKLSYKCNQAATRNIVLRARITEVRAA
jgi:hypothetical protein